MKWLVVLDPLDGLVARTDTSISLINKAREKNIEVFTATIDRLFFETHAAVVATAANGEVEEHRLAHFDLILMRKEPPYDLAFHYATQLLSLAGTRVVNSPTALREFNEKLIALPFRQYMPPTLVSSDIDLLKDFVVRHGTCVVKILDSFQGRSVKRVDSAEDSLLWEYSREGTLPVMVQQFNERVYEGDKRVIMVGDRFLGAAMRRPKKGFHANFANSDALKTVLTPHEKEIIDTLGPWLVKHDIHFVGLDLIGEQLTEINITCPTGIVQISELDGKDLAGEIVDYFVELTRKQPGKEL